MRRRPLPGRQRRRPAHLRPHAAAAPPGRRRRPRRHRSPGHRHLRPRAGGGHGRRPGGRLRLRGVDCPSPVKDLPEASNGTEWMGSGPGMIIKDGLYRVRNVAAWPPAGDRRRQQPQRRQGPTRPGQRHPGPTLETHRRPPRRRPLPLRERRQQQAPRRHGRLHRERHPRPAVVRQRLRRPGMAPRTARRIPRHLHPHQLHQRQGPRSRRPRHHPGHPRPPMGGRGQPGAVVAAGAAVMSAGSRGIVCAKCPEQ